MTVEQRTVVAVIDDDPGIREALAQLLSAKGYSAELFASAQDFLSVAPTSEAKCLVIDIELGPISGVELARQLIGAGFQFPIIFMTGSDNSTIRTQAMKLGCLAYLYKPFPLNRLLAAIEKAVADGSKV